MADGGAPAFIKRSKHRTARAREPSPSEDAPNTKTDADASPSTLAAKIKKQHKERVKPKARLSFGGDEEEGDGESFKVKKTLSSGLKRKSSGIALPSNLDQASITSQAQSSGIVYTKEYLSELKSSTLSTPPAARPPITNYDTDMSFDATEVAGAVIVDTEMTEESVSGIPAESAIQAAKEKRERLKQTKTQTSQGEEDFISLSVTRRDEGYQGPHPESRLMREDDELGEGDDEFAEFTSAQERIALGKQAKKKEAAIKRNNMIELIQDAEEEDEETVEWEKEQIRRGARQEPEVKRTLAKQEYRPSEIPSMIPLPTLDVAINRLSQSLSQLTTSHATNTASMSHLADEREALESKEKEMRDMVEKAETKRSWFNAFREWVETVATFLDEKYPILEKLEEEHVSLLKERNDMVSKRRLQDDEDDLSFFMGPLLQINADIPEELDELGRVIPRQNPTVARKGRRTYRTARHLKRSSTIEEEGYSTDSSLSPSDETDYQTALSNLHDKGRDVLQDVKSVEFRDPRMGVAKWFGNWRERYSDTYTGAFGGLGMISAWEFWVRLEMLGWDPAADPRALDSFKWFGSLYDYSRPKTTQPAARAPDGMDEDDSDVEPGLGPDGDLVSAMISTAVVPRLCKIILGGAFDPYSSRHVRYLIDLAEQVEASATQDKHELLLKSVITPFRKAVEDTTNSLRPFLESGNSVMFDPEAIPARRRYLMKRFKLLSNLLKWRKYTAESFGVGELVEKLVKDCIQPIAKSGWEVGGEEVMQRVTKVLPPELRNVTLL